MIASKETPWRYLVKRPAAAQFAAWKASAESGEAFEAYLIGRCYEEGWRTRRDERKALFWYRVAAGGGCREAFYFVAALLAWGSNEDMRQPKLALQYFQRAARLGDRDALYQLGCAYLDGDGVGVNRRKGLELLRKSASMGSEHARTAIQQLRGR